MITRSFRTVLTPFSYKFTLSYRSKMLFVGSCFTENIGRRMENSKFNVNINPFGIVYNPISLVQSLNFILEKKQFAGSDLFFHNEYWHSFFHHGCFSDTDKQRCSDRINFSVRNAYEFIKNTDILFITFGTTWVYKLKETGQIVSNCHKLPSTKFVKECLTEKEIVVGFKEFIDKIRLINKKIKIVLSLSPVRHLKDGFIENSLSKAILRTSVEKIKETSEGIFYFPAYEIVNDDLRDYRFYNNDLVHPNETATEYIFDFFKNAFFDDETEKIFKSVKKILSAKNHRLFNSETEQSKKFIDFNLNEIDKLTDKYPFISFKDEVNYFNGLK